MIARAAGYAAEELRADNSLRGLDRDRFIERLAHHYDQFNYLHPFREGNGRTQRVFWNRVSRDAGWQLDWRAVTGAINDQACRAASEERNFKPLHEMFSRVVTTGPPRTERGAAWRTNELARLSFPTSTIPMPRQGGYPQAGRPHTPPRPARSRTDTGLGR